MNDLFTSRDSDDEFLEGLTHRVKTDFRIASFTEFGDGYFQFASSPFGG